jgi:hypothetical protein
MAGVRNFRRGELEVCENDRHGALRSLIFRAEGRDRRLPDSELEIYVQQPKDQLPALTTNRARCQAVVHAANWARHARGS